MSLSDDIERLPLLRAPLDYTGQSAVQRHNYSHFLPDIGMVSVLVYGREWGRGESTRRD